MISIRFEDAASETAALGFLAGRCSFKSFDGGTTLVPEMALSLLAAQGVRFVVVGQAAYEQLPRRFNDGLLSDGPSAAG
jgi:hypothetical protein